MIILFRDRIICFELLNNLYYPCVAASSLSLASSLERNGRRLIAVGSGFETKNSRLRESTKLLTYGLTNFDLVEINKSSYSTKPKIVMIDDVESLNLNAANAILKAVEEPNNNTYFFFILKNMRMSSN